jgi:translocation and assembly module TamB
LKAAVRWILWLTSGMLLLLLTTLGLMWVWISADSSFNTALLHAARWLPAGHSLQTHEVQGSIAEGGHIGWLRWQHDSLSVEASGVYLRWSPAALLEGKLHISELAINTLRVQDQRPAAPDSPTVPPTQLGLPLKVQASVRVGALQWISSTPQDFGVFGFEYIFDSYQHKLDKGYADILSNKFSFSGQLQAQGNLALALQVAGTVRQAMPGSPQTLEVPAQAELNGFLAGQDSKLTLTASLQPRLGQDLRRQNVSAAMQAQLSAQVTPWQTQKIIQAQGHWQRLNLAALWPQLPQTRLDGTLTVQPRGPTWQARVQLRNTLPGPLDQQRVPLQSADAEFSYLQGGWRVQTLQALGAGGRVLAQGQIPAAAQGVGLSPWQAQMQVTDINPAAIDSRLPADAISGNISARQETQGIHFEVKLAGRVSALSGLNQPPVPNTAPGLQLMAQGVWTDPQLRLSQLRITTDQAQLQAQLDYHSTEYAGQGQLTLDLPGLHATVAGQLGRTDGAGNTTFDLSDAALAMRWLERWPGMRQRLGSALAATQLKGQAHLSAQWQGGWQNQGHDLALKAQVRSPRFDWAPRTSAAASASQPAGRSRELQIDASGTLDHFVLEGRGEVDFKQQQMAWRTRVQASRTPTDAWQAQLQQLDLDLRVGQPQQRWQLALGDPAGSGSATAIAPPGVLLDWTTSAQRQTLNVAAGQAHLKGPLGGTSLVQWQPIRWSQDRASADSTRTPPPQWQSQGKIDRLPLAWVDLLGSKTLADLGLGSDLTFSGQWDAAQSDTLHASLLLERSAGDLRLLAGTVGDQMVPAGMRETRLQVNLDGDRLSANLRWDSQRAGRALMAISTQIQQPNQTWALPGTAPVGGSLQLDLPPMDAWSVLAPPGWRMRGTMNAHVNLEGTVAEPKWSGTLQANDLALRSLVDGIDFSQGRFEARLHDQQLDISSFSLRGAGASGARADNSAVGGTLNITGSAQLQPGNTTRNGLHLQLQAKAQALRLSARPDRRVTVSGNLSADWLNDRLTVRGALLADQALFTLPEDSTPRLGSDVVVHGADRLKAEPRPAAGNATSTDKTPQIDLEVDLDPGKDFQIRGMGVETRLAGKLKLSAKNLTQPNLNGTLRTVDGTYRAYGQRLDIERGLIRFTGPADNPALTVLAIRPKLTQRVGVQISGTALAPIITLYADPDLPEADKLGWLLLGRSPTGGGAEAAVMQQAALALLGKTGQGMTDGLSQALGLDEISFGSGGSTTTSSSDTGNADSGSASITLGKRLSKDFYVAYESSFNGAMGVLRIFYDLSKNLTLRAQTGEESAVDLIYTLRYD